MASVGMLLKEEFSKVVLPPMDKEPPYLTSTLLRSEMKFAYYCLSCKCLTIKTWVSWPTFPGLFCSQHITYPNFEGN